MTGNIIDIREDDILQRSPELLATLLKDHTMSRAKGIDWNIFWATSDYENLGDGFQYSDQITPEHITGQYGCIVQPRVCKDKETRQARSRDKAEVFTPSWVCNAQNNLVDSAWFGREGVFNIENPNHTWTPNLEPVTFPDGKTWLDYVREPRLEITCGEAPYLVSRYDTVSGEFIPIENRIGLLDRKLRIVSENCHTSAEWLAAAQDAYKNSYGYEWQGDSLLIARETLLYTFIEYYKTKFGEEPTEKSIKTIAYIISWNLWQMDGLRGVIPDSCHSIIETAGNRFGIDEPMQKCEGCCQRNIHRHNGIYCRIRDWKNDTVITFVSLIKPK